MSVTDRASKAPNYYAPFDLVSDPQAFSLRRANHPSSVGRIAYYYSAEESSSHVTVFLHGLGSDWSVWSPVLLAARSQGYDTGSLCLFDLPGFGASAPATNLDATRVAWVLCDVLERHGWETVDLIGHSMGGFLALHAAALRLKPLRRVVAVSGAYVSLLNVVNRRITAARQHPLVAASYLTMLLSSRFGWAMPAPLANSGLERAVVRRAISGFAAHPDRLPDGMFSMPAAKSMRQSFRLAARNGKSYDFATRWSGINVPALVTFGDRDPLIPLDDERWLTRNVPNLTTLTTRDCGHYAPVEHPYQVAELVWPEGSVGSPR